MKKALLIAFLVVSSTGTLSAHGWRGHGGGWGYGYGYGDRDGLYLNRGYYGDGYYGGNYAGNYYGDQDYSYSPNYYNNTRFANYQNFDQGSYVPQCQAPSDTNYSDNRAENLRNLRSDIQKVRNDRDTTINRARVEQRIQNFRDSVRDNRDNSDRMMNRNADTDNE